MDVIREREGERETDRGRERKGGTDSERARERDSSCALL
jgi:hypothetical protein